MKKTQTNEKKREMVLQAKKERISRLHNHF